MKLPALVSFLLQGIYPSYCYMCQRLVQPGQVLCTSCVSRIPRAPVYRRWLSRHRCLVVHAAGAYRPPLDGLVRAKTHAVRYAAVQLGMILAQYLQRRAVQYDLLIPVPLHWSRYLWRGYNQAHVMAQVISELTMVQMVQPFRRRRYTSLQKRLHRDKRFCNVAGVFDHKQSWQLRDLRRLLAGKRVLLIDDVYTSGATLSSFAGCVWRFQPKLVHAAVGCRVLL